MNFCDGGSAGISGGNVLPDLPGSEADDEVLARQLADLDEKAVGVFADRFGLRFRQVFMARGLWVAEAEALAITTVTQIVLNIDKYQQRPGSTFRQWAFVVALHLLADWRRQQRDTIPLSERILWRGDVEAPGVCQAVVDAVSDALTRLSPRDRTLIRLRYFDPVHTEVEIAAQLGITSNNVAVSLSRAKKRLAVLLRVEPRVQALLRRRGILE